MLDKRLPTSEVMKEYPQWCANKCAAWSAYRQDCNCKILGDHLCKWTVNELTARINELMKVKGKTWWK